MNVNFYVLEDYENETAFRPKKTNPIQTQFKKRVKLIQSVYLQRIMKKNAAKGYEKTNPKQTQSNPISNAHKATKGAGIVIRIRLGTFSLPPVRVEKFRSTSFAFLFFCGCFFSRCLRYSSSPRIESATGDFQIPTAFNLHINHIRENSRSACGSRWCYTQLKLVAIDKLFVTQNLYDTFF